MSSYNEFYIIVKSIGNNHTLRTSFYQYYVLFLGFYQRHVNKTTRTWEVILNCYDYIRNALIFKAGRAFTFIS